MYSKSNDGFSSCVKCVLPALKSGVIAGSVVVMFPAAVFCAVPVVSSDGVLFDCGWFDCKTRR